MKFFLLLALLFFVPSYAFAASLGVPGSDRDEHGCIGSAGYSWSSPLEKCIRSWEYYTIDIASLPLLGNEKLEKMVLRETKRIEQQFRQNAEEIIRDMSGEVIDPDRYMLNITYEVVNTGSIISVLMNTYTYLGGAHGADTVSTWNYDTKARRLIPLWKVVTPTRLKTESKRIADSLQSYYTKEGYPLDKVWLEEGLNPKVIANYKSWTLSTDASGNFLDMLVYFADYQVGPHAIGMPKAKINLAPTSK
ncbi:MAG: DUF3298 and DUF4163 domain-containing protein [Candidatus Altimarinota bacterium]